MPSVTVQNIQGFALGGLMLASVAMPATTSPSLHTSLGPTGPPKRPVESRYESPSLTQGSRRLKEAVMNLAVFGDRPARAIVENTSALWSPLIATHLAVRQIYGEGTQLTVSSLTDVDGDSDSVIDLFAVITTSLSVEVALARLSHVQSMLSRMNLGVTTPELTLAVDFL